jgi:hypothetical protein
MLLLLSYSLLGCLRPTAPPYFPSFSIVQQSMLVSLSLCLSLSL